MKNCLPIIPIIPIILFMAISCSQVEHESDSPPSLSSPYFGLRPTQMPQMLVPDFISSSLTEYNGTFNPEGSMFFFTREAANKGFIAYTYMQADSSWSKPAIAPFSGRYSEYDPLFSPDGSRLYFSSERPLTEGGKQGKSRIWYVERTGKSWSEPIHLPLSDKGDYYSSLTEEGTIYYNIWNTGNIMKASKTDSTYISEALPSGPQSINGRTDAGDPFISPKEDYIIYRAYYQEGMGRGDLYISFRIEGKWTVPENLGSPINSSSHEMCPWVSSDGNWFIFSSDRLQTPYPQDQLEKLEEKVHSIDNGLQNIYYMRADFIDNMRSKQLE
ncbi:MAG: hypothetical protein AAFY71_10225 [Bacteroidota bacterium]